MEYIPTTWINQATKLGPSTLQPISDALADATTHHKTGTHAARPAANAASKGWIYFETDTGVTFANFDGANWTAIAGQPPSAGDASTITVDVTGVGSYTFQALDGDVDEAYEITMIGSTPNTGAGRNLTVRPNNITATQDSLFFANFSAPGSSAPSSGNFDQAANSGLHIIETYSTAATDFAARGVLQAKTGQERVWTCFSTIHARGGRNTENSIAGGHWRDTTTKITSLTIDCGGGTFTGTIILRKLAKVGQASVGVLTGGKYVATYGNGVATQYDIPHNMGTRDLNVQVREAAANFRQVFPEVQMLDVNTVRLIHDVAPTAGQYVVTVSSIGFVPQGGFVTALPSAPADGMEVHYMPDPTNATGNGNVVWHLKYRQSDGKWYYIGGPPLTVTIDTDETFAADGAFHNATTTGPQITVPVAGDYLASFDANLYMSAQTPPFLIGVSINNAAVAVPHQASTGGGSVSGGSVTVTKPETRMTGRVAGDVVALVYNTSINPGGVAHARWRRLSLRPIRVG